LLLGKGGNQISTAVAPLQSFSLLLVRDFNHIPSVKVPIALQKDRKTCDISLPLSIKNNGSMLQEFLYRWKRRGQCLSGSINQTLGLLPELLTTTLPGSRHVLQRE